MVKFKCPGCGVAFKLPEEMMGKSGKCPKCGAGISVPSRPMRSPGNTNSPVDATPSPSDPIDMGSWDTSSSQPANTRKRAWPLWAALGGGIVIASVIGYWVFLRDLSDLQPEGNGQEIELAGGQTPEQSPRNPPSLSQRPRNQPTLTQRQETSRH